MTFSQTHIFRQKGPILVAILWGGGLGDLIVLRSFVLALQAKKNVQVHLLTTATHLPEILTEICREIILIQLAKRPGSLIQAVRQWHGTFDLVYLGPYPTWKSRLMGHVLGHSRIWSRRHKKRHSFLLEQVQADIQELGLLQDHSWEFPYGASPWEKGQQHIGTKKELKPYLVLHMSSKDQWKTTSWPTHHWKSLILHIIQETDLTLYIVGVDSEKSMLTSFRNSLPPGTEQRVKLSISLPLQDVFSLIAFSSGVICHNSGILHLATVIQKKIVCLTGSSAMYWRPPYPWVKNVTSGQCRLACNSYNCPIPFFKAKCIRKLTVEKVLQAVKTHILSAPEGS